MNVTRQTLTSVSKGCICREYVRQCRKARRQRLQALRSDLPVSAAVPKQNCAANSAISIKIYVVHVEELVLGNEGSHHEPKIRALDSSVSCSQTHNSSHTSIRMHLLQGTKGQEKKGVGSVSISRAEACRAPEGRKPRDHVAAGTYLCQP